MLALALGVSAIKIIYAYRSYKLSQSFSEILQPKVAEDAQHYHQGAIDLFHKVNAEGIALALLFSPLSAAGLSVLLTCVLTQLLKKIERAAKRFSEGVMESRVPPLAIPSLHQLGLTTGNDQ